MIPARDHGVVDFVLRLAFFAAAPFLLVFVAAFFPVTGALAQVALGLAAFFAGEALRRWASRSKVVRLALSSQLQFEAYYREHPPRTFLYYVFYPLLAPYWLFARQARREFLLFKGYTLASFALLLVSLVVQYLRFFPPELSVKAFLPIAAGTLAVETVVVLMFLMPIVTTVVYFHTLRAPWRLGAVLLAGIVSATVAVVRIEGMRDPVVSYATRTRVRLRTAAKPKAAEAAQITALRTAWKALPKDKQDVDHDGKVEGSVLDAAHASLGAFYKKDEANAFDLWSTRSGKNAIVILYFEARGKKDPIWLALTGNGTVTHDVRQLPRGAFDAMYRLTQ
ncbi:MAG TPA: hypothetical protein VGL81_02600 [Polyangiaceae bacterium]